MVELSPADAECIAFTPAGHKFSMLLISYLKWALNQPNISTDSALEFLEGIERCAKGIFSFDRVCAIEPMCSTQVEMLLSALRLDGDAMRLNGSWDILTDDETFSEFVKLNPSLLRAAQMRQEAA